MPFLLLPPKTRGERARHDSSDDDDDDEDVLVVKEKKKKEMVILLMMKKKKKKRKDGLSISVLKNGHRFAWRGKENAVDGGDEPTHQYRTRILYFFKCGSLKCSQKFKSFISCEKISKKFKMQLKL